MTSAKPIWVPRSAEPPATTSTPAPSPAGRKTRNWSSRSRGRYASVTTPTSVNSMRMTRNSAASLQREGGAP